MLSQRGSLQYQTYSLLDFVKRCQFIRYGFLWSSILSSGCPTRTQRYKSQICIAQSLQFNSYLPHLLQVTLIQVTTMRVSTFIAFIALVLSGVSAAAAPAEGMNQLQRRQSCPCSGGCASPGVCCSKRCGCGDASDTTCV
ncbi:hypothetical protein CPB85DRAFT_1269687 [Mucidula mucida]|nr:hypothetical protein CPB85DRAFT_1269687 [Mucidula mucida]